MTPYDPIIDAVAAEYGVSVDDIFSRSRLRVDSDARQMAMYLLDEIFGLQKIQIGAIFNRSHSTVIFAIQKMKFLIIQDSEVGDHYRNIIQNID